MGGYYALTQPNRDSAFRWGLKLTLEDGTDEVVLSEKRWAKLNSKPLRLRDIQQVYLDHEGTAVWTRPDVCRATHAKAMRQQHGIRIVAELDDNYLSDPKFNYFMRVNNWSASDRLDHMKAVCSMDGLIVTTEWLRDHYWKLLAKEFGKRSVPPIHICSNHIDERYIVEPTPPRPDGKLRVGFMGSESHLWDVKLIYPALKWAHDEGHEIVFVGMDPQWRHKLEYTHVPWQLPEEYRRQALPLDIGLAPLLSNTHTFGKSDIKHLEYALSGAAAVLQNNVVYNKTARHGETAMLAGSPEEFWIWTQRLVNDPKLRASLVTNTRQYIKEERMLADHRKDWEQAVLG